LHASGGAFLGHIMETGKAQVMKQHERWWWRCHEQKKRVLVPLVPVAIFPYVLLVGLLCLIQAIRLHRHKTLIVMGRWGWQSWLPRVPFDVRIERREIR
jgi:hypothetical protein